MTLFPSIEPADASETRDGFRFRSGWPALDLTATLTGRLKPTQTELLVSPADLDRWLAASGLASAALKADENDLTAARALRECIYAIALQRINNEPPSAKARGLLNRMARADAAAPELNADGVMRWKGPPQTLLTVIAREAVGLFGSGVSARIRQCEATPCAMLFVDLSRSGDRRWCSMASCGNKAKVAEYRRRKREKSAK